jgi:predicted nucleic acid-binding protein
MKVVDASAMVDVLTGAPTATRLIQMFDDDLFAPHLLISEVTQQIRRLLLSGAVDDAHAHRLVLAFRNADIEYVTVAGLVDKMWTMRHNVSAYDATYVALAADLRCARASGLPATVISPK